MESGTKANTVKVSVIIPAFNEERFLSGVISAVQANKYPATDYEIIVVNNGSTDRTAVIARKAGVLVVESERKFVGVARNLGARQAHGEILAFLDADCFPAEDWLREGVRSLAQEHCVTGAECGIPDDAGWMERSWFSQKRFGRIEVTHINTANLFVSRELFVKLGGFDETLSSGEDYEFCSRAKSLVRIMADDRIRVVHMGNPKTIKAFVIREMWHGVGALSSLKHNWFDKPFLGTIIFAIFSVLQLLGIIAVSEQLFLLGCVGVAGVLLLTVLYRVVNGARVPIACQLFVLYYFYYLGRMIAIGMLVTGIRSFQRTR
jgi:glycosyltransferase involved in cell wall biosynthesis